MNEPTLPAPTPGILPTDPERRTWMLTTGAVGSAAAVATAVPFVSSFALKIPPHRSLSETGS